MNQILKCPYCGGEEFIFGVVREEREYVRFKADDSGFWALGKPLDARACKACGSVQLFLPANQLKDLLER